MSHSETLIQDYVFFLMPEKVVEERRQPWSGRINEISHNVDKIIKRQISQSEDKICNYIDEKFNDVRKQINEVSGNMSRVEVAKEELYKILDFMKEVKSEINCRILELKDEISKCEK